MPANTHTFRGGSSHQDDGVGNPQWLQHPGRFARGQVEQDGGVVILVGLVHQVVQLALFAIAGRGGIGG